MATSPSALTLNAQEILRAAEIIRNPQENYEVKVTLEDSRNGKTETHTYLALVKGRTKSLVKFLTPPEDQGTKVLLADDQMWVYVPTVAKPIRIAARQRISGNAAYGDVVRLSFLDNYTATVLKTENFDKQDCVVLELNSIPGKVVTYDKIEYWINRKTHRPIKALYQTSSGKTLREGYFEGYQDVLGVSRPTIFVLVDFLQQDHKTTITFSEAQKKKFPDLLFEKQNLGRN